MRNFYLKATQGIFYTPEVKLNVETGHCKITGESQADNAVKFYTPILDWVEQYIKQVRGMLVFDFQLIYFDTSSSKFIHQILKRLRKYEIQGGKVIVNWHYPEDNEDVLDEGLQFSEDIGLDITFLPYVNDEAY
ncbi:MAG TPA: hypothetical protein DCS93_27285 [Microscillaceae bacterium]|nr:hypothetical protein [Microscillaceae bacterium]